MTFGAAIEALKEGSKVRRIGWNGKNVWLELHVIGSNPKTIRPYIYMKTITDLVPWVASHADLLAEDWIRLRQRGRVDH